MIRRIAWLAVMGVIAFVFYYLSRFYALRLWGRDGLFGIPDIGPQGGLLARWLRGTVLQPYELIVWLIGVFLILTALQKIHDKLKPAQGGKDDG